MSSLHRQFFKGLAQLADLPEDAFERLEDAMSKTHSFDEFLGRLGDDEHFQPFFLTSLYSNVYSQERLRASLDMTIEQMAGQIGAGTEEALDGNDFDRDLFEKRLARLFKAGDSNELAKESAKAEQGKSPKDFSERTLCKVSSQVKLVYVDEAPSPLLELRIGYHNRDGHQDLHLTLDLDDIEKFLAPLAEGRTNLEKLKLNISQT